MRQTTPAKTQRPPCGLTHDYPCGLTHDYRADESAEAKEPPMSGHFGAELQLDGQCRWRFWAPKATRVELVLMNDAGNETAVLAMQRRTDGFFSREISSISAGQRYCYRIDGQIQRPDPASFWQPEGVHEASATWCPQSFQWSDQHWRGLARKDLVLYELHVGTFTTQGTFTAIIPRLSQLRDLGITAIELMPVAQFPGCRGWGYDGTYWYAVQQSYGGPTGLQQLVDACHANQMAVILDVVYNHMGPEGNYLSEYSHFFSDRHQTGWGMGINYDGPSSQIVRSFVLENVRHWIREFHIDGLRLDAVHAIQDDSKPHLLAEIKQAALAEESRCGRPLHIIAESNLNDVTLLSDFDKGGYGLDAQWNDDFHHCVHALLTGERTGYYVDFHDPARQLVKALNQAFVFDGTFSLFLGRMHGRSADGCAGDRFVISVQNHDQVGNRPLGDRFGAILDLSRQRLAAGLLLLAPGIPLIFMGEEYGETRPFPFFCDFDDASLRAAVVDGRKREHDAMQDCGQFADPNARSTFESAVLTWEWPASSRHAALRSLYQDLLNLRRSHQALRDYEQSSAFLIQTPCGNLLLQLNRGDPKTANSLQIFFNLGATKVTIPSRDVGPSEVLLMSDHPKYGGDPAGIGQTRIGPIDSLPPCSFIIFCDPPATSWA